MEKIANSYFTQRGFVNKNYIDIEEEISKSLVMDN